MARVVLLVDDDDDDVRVVGRLSLEAVGGWTVREAATGNDAVALAVADPPDAILLDVMMPDTDGATVVARLRERPETRDIPVVLLTAYTQAQLDQRFSDVAVQGTLTKPFDPMTLADELARVLGWSP